MMYDPHVVAYHFISSQPKSGLTVQVVGARAKSLGKVMLASKDPLKKPRIECR